MTHSLNKYVTCTYNAQIRHVSIGKMLPGGDNERAQISFTAPTSPLRLVHVKKCQNPAIGSFLLPQCHMLLRAEPPSPTQSTGLQHILTSHRLPGLRCQSSKASFLPPCTFPYPKHWSATHSDFADFQDSGASFLPPCTLPDPKIVSEYDQEIPQSQSADNPVAP